MQDAVNFDVPVAIPSLRRRGILRRVIGFTFFLIPRSGIQENHSMK
jgi:hypothetical protein